MFGIMANKGGDCMIRVAICDDDKRMQKSLSKYLLDYSIQCDREIDHSEFDTCEELMDEYLKGNSFDVILLDIEFKNNDEKQMNGIELGKRLRGLYANDNTAIVYVTSYGEYAIDSIKIRPYDYIKKPITYERIVEFFETYYFDQARRKRCLNIMHLK